MTSLEWVEVKKRLSKQENEASQRLAAIPDGPRYVGSDENPDVKVATLRGALCEAIADIQRTRNSLRPKRRR